MADQIPLNALKVFEAVARSKSFTRAAEELCVTQSAVSHQIRLLENWLGQPLFDRNGRIPTLLPHGITFADVLRSAFADIDFACRFARTSKGISNLGIAVIPSVATCWLIPRMNDFRLMYPVINTRIVYALHGQQVDFRDVDVALVYSTGPLAVAGAEVSRFLGGESSPVCSQTFLELYGPLDTPHKIMAAPLLHDCDMAGWQRWFMKAEGQAVVPPAGPVYEDFSLLRAATLAGQGISLCPLSIIEDDLKSGRLRCLSDVSILGECAYYILTSLGPQRPEVTAFRDWVLSA
jgi:LysR family transcriptional regulator, glycine cleavage system transcriptional activator